MPFGNLRPLWFALKIFSVILLLTSSPILYPASAQEHKSQEPAFLKPVLDQKLQIEMTHVSLAVVLKMLAKQTGVNFIADGEPTTISINFKSSGTLREALDTLCENLDYSWKPTKSGLIVMNKRFFRGDTLPQVHDAEIIKFAKDIINALSALSYDAQAEELRLKGMTNPHWPEMLDGLASALTPDQVSTLRRGAQLPITDLMPQQRATMEDIILTATLSPTRNEWVGLLEILKGLPKGYMRVEFCSGPQFCGFTPVDKNKVIFPSSFVMIQRPQVVFTNKLAP